MGQARFASPLGSSQFATAYSATRHRSSLPVVGEMQVARRSISERRLPMGAELTKFVTKRRHPKIAQKKCSQTSHASQ